MDFFLGRDPFFTTVHHLLHPTEGHLDKSPAQNYMRERNAMASTAVDVKEYPNAYVFVADMPGLKSSDIKVSVENDNVLVLSGERRKEEETEKDVKYLSFERRSGKFMRKFTLPGNADLEKISATCHDGVLTVTVQKVPPPTPKTMNITVG